MKWYEIFGFDKEILDFGIDVNGDKVVDFRWIVKGSKRLLAVILGAFSLGMATGAGLITVL